MPGKSGTSGSRTCPRHSSTRRRGSPRSCRYRIATTPVTGPRRPSWISASRNNSCSCPGRRSRTPTATTPSARRRPATASVPARSGWPGCWPGRRRSCPSPAPDPPTTSRRTSPPRESSSARMSLPRSPRRRNAATRDISADDIRAGLDELRGHPLHTTISSVRSLFRFARKHGRVFANPAQRLSAAVPEPILLPMTDNEIRAVEQAITLPGQRLIVALAAVHAARWEATQALRAWLDYRRATWPHTPDRHVLISEKTALGDGPVTRGYLDFHLKPHGASIERIRRDRILHEALTGRPDPLHLSLMFGISERPASQYARIARDLLAEPPGPEDDTRHDDPGERE